MIFEDLNSKQSTFVLLNTTLHQYVRSRDLKPLFKLNKNIRNWYFFISHPFSSCSFSF